MGLIRKQSLSCEASQRGGAEKCVKRFDSDDSHRLCNTRQEPGIPEILKEDSRQVCTGFLMQGNVAYESLEKSGMMSLDANEIVDAIYKLKPIQFNLEKLFVLTSKASIFGKLLMIQKIRESLASPFEDILAQFCFLSKQDKDISMDLDNNDSTYMSMNVSSLLDDDLYLHLSKRMIHSIKMTLDVLDETLESQKCNERIDSCCGNWKDLVGLLAPVEKRPLKISALIPAMEWLRQHPDGISMKEYKELTAKESQSEVWATRWEVWSKLADECWAIKKYVDPAFVFLEEAEGAAFSDVIESANYHCAHSVPRLPEPAMLDVHQGFGSAPSRLRRFSSTEDATKVASALRTHLSIPGNVNAGGNGPAARICTFSCFNMVWW